MQPMRNPNQCGPLRSSDSVLDLVASLDAGGDPRRAIHVLNERIVDCQRRGVDLPANFLRLTRSLAAECVGRQSN